MNMPLSVLNRRRRIGAASAPAFSPSTLFALAEPGVWYDPSDLSTLFTDTAGTTPVTTPGNTVALMLDKSKGLTLGAELVVNGDFSGGSTGWTLSSDITISGGVLSQTASGTAQSFSTTLSSFPAGTYYLLEMDMTTSAGTIAFLTVRFGGTSSGYTVASNVSAINGKLSLRVFKDDAGSILHFALPGAWAGTIDNISVRELAGNHATQATAASRPTFGVVPLGGRRNLLLQTEDFSNAAWSKIGSPTLTNQGGGVWRLQASAASTWFLTQNTSLDTTGVVTFDVKSNGGGLDIFRLTVDGGVSSDLTATSDWNRLSFSRSHTGTGPTGITRDAANSAVDILIRFPQFELGSTATNYQRTTTQFDVTEAGVQSLSYLSFDGVDDFMVTPTITPGVDKAQVFAGVRKLSDAAQGVLIETSSSSATNAGTIGLHAPRTVSNRYGFNSQGTVLASVVTASATYDAPNTSMISGLADIAGDSVILRVNGSQIAQSTGDQGTGNYLAYPLYIGRRGGTSVPFNGQIYSLITRFGATLDTTAITNTETWVAGKTGISL